MPLSIGQIVGDDILTVPPPLYHAIRAYLAAGKHGNITLNVKDGKILSWALTEMGRIDNNKHNDLA